MEGKIALVTGASRGIGSAIAQKLAAAGTTVIVNYSGSEAKAQEVVDKIKAAGGNAVAMKCDVSDFGACKELADAILKEFGRLDILVNNAGITKDGLIMKMTESDFDQVIAINLKGTFNMIQNFSRTFLKQRSGKIINISSVSGVMGNAGQANYAASKAGIIGLTKSVARELASRHVCVNAIAPGFVETDMTDNMPQAAKDGMTQMIPMGRLGAPEDIANAALFLASDAADYITGQVLCVDGGMAI